jgi:hypothetical protein
MMSKLKDFEDVSLYTMEPERRNQLLKTGRECVVNWATRDGWPVGVMHIYFWHHERFWVTCTEQRKRVAALRRSPRSSVVVAFPEEQTITAKTMATVHSGDGPHADWLYPSLAKRVLQEQPPEVQEQGVPGFVARLASESRVIIELEPVQWITFDGRRVKAHAAGDWTPGEPWSEPAPHPVSG